MRRSLNLWLALLLVVCGASIWFGRGDVFDRPGSDITVDGVDAPRPTVTAGLTEAAGIHPPVHVSVLNGTEQDGLAREYGAQLTRLGYVAVVVGNAPRGDFVRTLLVNRRLPPEPVEQLASRLGGVPVVREFDPRCTEDVVLVLGADAARRVDRLRSLAGADPLAGPAPGR